MSQDVRGSLLLDDGPALDCEDSNWEDEDFDLTEEDFEVIESMAWEANDLPIAKDQDRCRRYLNKKQ